MTLLELITALREDYLDDLGGDGVDWTDSAKQNVLRWSNTALTRYINEAYREVVRRTQCLHESTDTTITNISILAGTSLYNISPLILEIDRAILSLEKQPLIPASWKDIEAIRSNWEAATGTPKYIINDWQTDTIRLYPEPIIADTLRMLVDRMPKKDLRLAQWGSDKPEIQEQWHYKMLHWAAHLAYSKDEPNTIDPQKASLHSGLFTQDFGVPDNAYTVERRKRPTRQARYWGL